MKQSTLLKVAAESIARNKMRSLLTMLGIVIGVAAVIVMVAIGNGARLQIESSIKKLGTNSMPLRCQRGGGLVRQFAAWAALAATSPWPRRTPKQRSQRCATASSPSRSAPSSTAATWCTDARR